MKKVMSYLLLGLLVMFLFTYITSLYDDAFRKTGIWYKDIAGSFKYYILWVLPYWWLIILVGTVLVGLLLYGIKLGIGKLKG